MDVTVVDVPEKMRFEGRLPDGSVAGFAAYDLRDGAILFLHTEVAAQHEGQGVAGRIVAEALGAARERGLRVVALCPYVRAFLRRHEDEYGDLVGDGPATTGVHPTGVHIARHEPGEGGAASSAADGGRA